MKARYLSLIVAVAAGACVIVSGCSKSADEKPVLTVSIEPQRQLLEQLAGDNFTISVLMPNGSNPETYDPSPAKRAAIEKSRAYFTTGYLPFEANLREVSNDTTIFVNTSEGIEPIYGTHNHEDGHNTFLPHDDHERLDADPHVWTSVRNARVIVENMTKKLVEIDPANADVYRERASVLDTRLDSIDCEFAYRLENLPSRTFLVWHPSLSYFARDYDLEQMAVGQESKEISISQLRKVIDEARADSVTVCFYQRDLDSRQAETVCNSIGARLVPINPGDYDWIAELSRVVDELSK